MDKAGKATVQTKPSNTINKHGSKQEGTINSAVLVLSAAVICVSEGGNFIPRIITFRRRNMKAALTDGAQTEAVFHVTNKEGHNYGLCTAAVNISASYQASN